MVARTRCRSADFEEQHQRQSQQPHYHKQLEIVDITDDLGLLPKAARPGAVNGDQAAHASTLSEPRPPAHRAFVQHALPERDRDMMEQTRRWVTPCHLLRAGGALGRPLVANNAYRHRACDEQKLTVGFVVHAGEAQMSAWIATALAVATVAVSPITRVNAGPCAPGSTRNCFNIPATIDFSSVPEISKQIASQEKIGQKQQAPTFEPPAAAPYTGPIFGASPLPGRTPTVGYSWSLE